MVTDGMIRVCFVICVCLSVSVLCLQRCFAMPGRLMEGIGGGDCREEASNGRPQVHVRQSVEEKCHRNVKCTSTKTRLLSEGERNDSPP